MDQAQAQRHASGAQNTYGRTQGSKKKKQRRLAAIVTFGIPNQLNDNQLLMGDPETSTLPEFGIRITKYKSVVVR
ncbi:hypothetical protein HI914_05070 [Erysiphe necator]|nr:hypothetical protein HI914_05070 [Erysiphe necator]